jgi:hypothetical protein
LLGVDPQGRSWLPSFIPLLWGVIGGSAAVVLGIRPDLLLLVADFALLVDLFAPRWLSTVSST